MKVGSSGTPTDTPTPYLYAGPSVLSTQAAGQSPAAGRDVGHLGDGLHLLRTADAHLRGGAESLNFFFCIEIQRKEGQLSVSMQSRHHQSRSNPTQATVPTLGRLRGRLSELLSIFTLLMSSGTFIFLIPQVPASFTSLTPTQPQIAHQVLS